MDTLVQNRPLCTPLRKQNMVQREYYLDKSFSNFSNSSYLGLKICIFVWIYLSFNLFVSHLLHTLNVFGSLSLSMYVYVFIFYLNNFLKFIYLLYYVGLAYRVRQDMIRHEHDICNCKLPHSRRCLVEK